MIVTRAGYGAARIKLRSSGIIDMWNTPVTVLPPGATTGGDPSVLPAASAAMRLIANDVSVLPLLVYREAENAQANAEKARDSWQWQLLHQQPQPGVPACQFWFDVAMGIIGRGKSYALKYRSGGRVSAMEYMGGEVIRRETGYDWYQTSGSRMTVVRNIPFDRVIHWRGPNFDGGPEGCSLIELHRQTFDTGFVQDEHQRALYTNGANPKIAFATSQKLTETQADEWIERYEARHRGARNSGKPVLLSDGVQVTPITVTAEDAQFLEQRQYNVADVERIFLLPPGTLQESHTRPAADADMTHRYVRQTIQPLLTLIEQTLEADTDLFGVGSTLYPEFQTGAILKADIQTRYEAYLAGRQAGWLSVNDIRAMENMPPIPEGDQYQTTPVGGAPNLQPQPEQTP